MILAFVSLVNIFPM